MPGQPVPVRPVGGVGGQADGGAVGAQGVFEVVVDAAVGVLVAQGGADAELVVGGDRDVAGVVEAVQIGAQEQAVGDLVGAAIGVGLDVGGVEDGQAVLAGGGAGAGVGLGDGEAEGALAEAGADELVGAVAVVCGGRVGGRGMSGDGGCGVADDSGGRDLCRGTAPINERKQTLLVLRPHVWYIIKKRREAARTPLNKDGTGMNSMSYKDKAAQDRLVELGLDAAALRRAVEEGHMARGTCTPNDPPLMPGIMAWGRMNRALREQLIPRGWVKKNDHGQPLTLSPDGSLAIVAFGGDDATGDPNRLPQPKHPKGSTTLSAIHRNTRQLSLFPTLVPDAVASQGPLTWILLVAHVGDELRSELSLPRAIDKGNIVVDWAERIILDPISLGDKPTVMPAAETTPIDVAIARRA